LVESNTTLIGFDTDLASVFILFLTRGHTEMSLPIIWCFVFVSFPCT